MSGGTFAKIGNWFEEDGVLGHLLRIADEQEQTLQWEGNFQHEHGVDCWIRTDSGRIAEQYKTKSTGPWTMGELADGRKRRDGSLSASVLNYASEQLQRTDAGVAAEYRFLTTTEAPDLNEAIEVAKAITDPVQWMNGDASKTKLRKQLIKGLRLDPDQPAEVALAHSLVKKMRVQVIDRQTLREHNQNLARALSSSPDLLMESLRTLAQSSLGRELTTEQVRQYLATSNISLVEKTDHLHVGPILTTAAQAFERSIKQVRNLSVIQRPEADDATNEAVAERARTIIVHGPAGVGKTEVLLQTVAKLHAKQIPTFIMRADTADRPQLVNPVRALSRYAGGKRACIVIDQLDQVVLAGDHAQHLITPLSEWIVLARALNISVIVGCRTIDVEQDTYLKRVLCPDDPDGFRKVPVGDLTEAQATAILSQMGIPITTLHMDLRPLARRPLVMHLLMPLVNRGGIYAPARTMLDLVVLWWERLREPHGTLANEVLNAIVAAVESDGTLSIDRLRLPHPSVIDGLLQTGVLIDEGQGCVRPFHQVIVDVWLARQWSDVNTFADLRQRIGDRQNQTLHHARRLRLAVQLFASRGRKGTTLCNEIVRSVEVRPLLKHAMLLGIAVIDAPNGDWVNLIQEWLDDPILRRTVCATVVYRRVAWMDALRLWLLRAWAPATPDQRHQLIRLLAAVGSTRGDLVAECLLAWSQHSPGVLTQAEFIFWHDQTEDSDQLFELRLRSYAESQRHRDHYLKWNKLLSGNPRRAVRLLAYHLNQASDEDIVERDPEWLHGWPSDVPQTVNDTGLATWNMLRDRWQRITVIHPWKIRADYTGRTNNNAVIVHVVDLVGGALAFAIDHNEITWLELITQLSAGNRFIDSWLLLRVGAKLNTDFTRTNVLTQAVQWFMSDITLGKLGIRMNYESSRLAEQFLATVCSKLDDETHKKLEQWLVGYSGYFTTTAEDDEARKYDRTTAIGQRLLDQTDHSRWSESTATFYALLVEQFGEAKPLDENIPRIGSAWVCSDIPDDRANEMSCAEWIEALRSASPSGERRESTTDKNTILSSEFAPRLGQLRCVVPHHQQRFLDGLPLFLAAVPPLSVEVLATVVSEIANKSTPDRPPPRGAWEPLDDAAIAEMFAIPQIRNEVRMAYALTDAVRNRSNFDWSNDIVDRMGVLAMGASVPGVTYNEENKLINYRLNERACQAIDALATLAHDHEDRRAPLLDFAATLIEHLDPGRRASAGMLAFHARSADMLRAFAFLLRVAEDPQVANEDDIGRSLYFVVSSNEASPELKQKIVDLLMGLIGGNERCARHGGQAGLLLRALNLITPEILAHALSGSAIARQAAAVTLAGGLKEDKAPAVWMRELAIRFANDDDEKVGDAILYAFDGDSGHLLQITNFFTTMVQSKAASRDQQSILKLCCKSADMVTIADEVLHMVKSLITLEVTVENQWRVSSAVDVSMNVLQALVARAEQVGDSHVRARALDAWDQLIERGESDAQNKLNVATDFSVG